MKTCGGCVACCVAVPVDAPRPVPGAVALVKRAFVSCPHQRDFFDRAGPGCGVYPNRPQPCRVWSCGWLTGPDLPDAARPDRCGVVLDPMVDLVRRQDGTEEPAAQVWVLPGYEEAFSDPLVGGMLAGLLDQVPVVLWRQRAPGREDRQAVRVIRKLDGGLAVGPLQEPSYNLGSEAERYNRVDNLVAKGKV